MLKNEDALICDLAETYHVLDYKALSLTLVATLASGLRKDSRSMMILTNTSVDVNTLLLAGVFDRLSFIAWTKTKDGQKGRNRPKSIVSAMTETKDRKVAAFSSGEDFKIARKRMLKSMDKGVS